MDSVDSLIFSGVRVRDVPTARVTTRVLDVGRDAGEPVVLVHGNVSSSLFFQPLLLDLPDRFRPLAPDLRGFGGTDPLPVDATRGVRDWSDDLRALLDSLHIDRAHLLGWSMGAGVVLQAYLDAADRVASLTLVSPVSPFGFGGTAGPDGRLLHPDGAGSGGGTANPRFVELLAAGDTTADDPASPRSVLRAFYVADPAAAEKHEDVWVASMLSTRIGEDHYPGDYAASTAWPGMAPGRRGVLNTMAPTVLRLDGIIHADPRPPILWVRGDADAIVSDGSMFDLAQLGALGAVPGWPGAEQAPPQPMVTQTRAVLDRWAETGGRYREVVLAGAGHSPHLERPQEFLDAFVAHLDASG